MTEASERNFADDERVNHDAFFAEQSGQAGITAAKVADPDGSVDEDH